MTGNRERYEDQKKDLESQMRYRSVILYFLLAGFVFFGSASFVEGLGESGTMGFFAALDFVALIITNAAQNIDRDLLRDMNNAAAYNDRNFNNNFEKKRRNSKSYSNKKTYMQPSCLYDIDNNLPKEDFAAEKQKQLRK